MNKKLLVICASCFLGLLAGCAGQVEPELPPVIEGGYPETDTSETIPGETDQSEEPDSSTQVTPPAQRSPNAAVQSLANQSRAHYNARNYQGAIATAERGLRIDRRSPELYLLLAQSYLQLAKPQQAEQFAQQGLRYSQAGSSVAEALQRVREVLASGGL